MNYQHDILDQVEDIYLTEDQFIHWLTSEMPRADCFLVKGEQLALKDMDPLYEPPPAPQYDLQQLVDGPSVSRWTTGGRIGIRSLRPLRGFRS